MAPRIGIPVTKIVCFLSAFADAWPGNSQWKRDSLQNSAHLNSSTTGSPGQYTTLRPILLFSTPRPTNIGNSTVNSTLPVNSKLPHDFHTPRILTVRPTITNTILETIIIPPTITSFITPILSTQVTVPPGFMAPEARVRGIFGSDYPFNPNGAHGFIDRRPFWYGYYWRIDEDGGEMIAQIDTKPGKLGDELNECLRACVNTTECSFINFVPGRKENAVGKLKCSLWGFVNVDALRPAYMNTNMGVVAVLEERVGKDVMHKLTEEGRLWWDWERQTSFRDEITDYDPIIKSTMTIPRIHPRDVLTTEDKSGGVVVKGEGYGDTHTDTDDSGEGRTHGTSISRTGSV